MSMNINAEIKSESFARLAFGACICSGTAALGGHILHLLPVQGGALFGACFGIPVTDFTNRLFGNTSLEKILKKVIDFFGRAFFAFAVVRLAGFSITFPASLGLALISVGTLIVTAVALTYLVK